MSESNSFVFVKFFIGFLLLEFLFLANLNYFVGKIVVNFVISIDELDGVSGGD